MRRYDKDEVSSTFQVKMVAKKTPPGTLVLAVGRCWKRTYVLSLLLEGLQGVNTALVLEELLDECEEFGGSTHGECDDVWRGREEGS